MSTWTFGQDIVPLSANDSILKELHWGQDVAGVSIALKMESPAIANSWSVQAKVYIKNFGNAAVLIVDFGSPLHGIDFYTRNEKGEIIKIHFGKGNDAIPIIVDARQQHIPQNAIYVFPVTISSEILNAAGGKLFSGVNVYGPKGSPPTLIYSNEVSTPPASSNASPQKSATP